MLMSPFALAYGSVAARRLERASPPAIDAPVLCVGNFTIGGSGKTPVAIALAVAARKMKLNPGFLTRGHGGSLRSPRIVDGEHDSARTTGDEPLLLARHAPVAAGTNRHAAAQLLRKAGCDFLIMDDGFQSRRLDIDYALMVVDNSRGIGNGYVIPAGPMRAPLVSQLRRTDAVLVMGSGDAGDDVVRMAARAAKPVYKATTVVRNRDALANRRFLAFAGIGNPEKFFDTVVNAGGWVSVTRKFPDHHLFDDREMKELLDAAASVDLELITTAKDAARLAHGSETAQRLLEQLTVLEIDVAFEENGIPAALIEETVKRYSLRETR